MRINVIDIENIVYKYFYINKFEQKIYEEFYELLNVNELVVKHDDIKTIDLVELIDKINILSNTENKTERSKIILNDFKEYIYEIYNISENIKNYQYASIPVLKNKKRYKKIDIINNPNIRNFDKKMDFDVRCMKVFITLIDGYSIERYVTDWKCYKNEKNIIGSFNCSGGNGWYNQKYIIRAEEYSK